MVGVHTYSKCGGHSGAMHPSKAAAQLSASASAAGTDVGGNTNGETNESKPVERVEPKSGPKMPPKPKASIPPPLSILNPKSARFQITMLLFFVVLVNAMTRNTMSMAIVCMVNTTASNDSSLGANDTQCPIGEEDHVKFEGSLHWDSKQTGFALSAMYWSGLLTAIPAGYFADRHSPKMIIAGCLLIGIIGCLLTPVAVAYGDLPALIAATLMPTVSSMTAKWIPPGDRTSCLALYTTGSQIGMIIAGPLNAFLCRQTSFLGGWPSIFYVTGVIVLPVLLTWFICAADKPRKYRWIRKDELAYITDSLAEQHLRKRKIRCRQIPWIRMLISGPLLVSLLANFAISMSYTMLQHYVPTYFKQSLKMRLAQNGLLSALPFLAQIVGKIVCAPIADYFWTKKILSPTWSCKIFNSIGAFGTVIFLIATAYTTCNEAGAAVAFVTISGFFTSFQIAGFITSLVAIAPTFTGIVNALGRFIAAIAAVITPPIVGKLTDGSADATTQWRNVFWLTAGISVGAGILFLVFGSAEIQDWAKRKEDEDEDNGSGSISEAVM